MSLSPWARNALSEDELRDLSDRQRELGCRVSAAYSSTHRKWTVRVTAGSVYVVLSGHGPLAAIMAGALDDFAETLVAA